MAHLTWSSVSHGGDDVHVSAGGPALDVTSRHRGPTRNKQSSSRRQAKLGKAWHRTHHASFTGLSRSPGLRRTSCGPSSSRLLVMARLLPAMRWQQVLARKLEVEAATLVLRHASYSSYLLFRPDDAAVERVLSL